MRVTSPLKAVLVSLTFLLATGLQAAESLQKADIEAALNAAITKYKSLKEGANADYIPALAKVDPNIFGIALVTPEPRDLNELGELEARIDGFEDRRQIQRLTRRGAGPGALLEEAECRDEVAALNLEMSVALRQLAHGQWRSVVRVMS